MLRRFGGVCCLRLQGDNLVGMDTKWLGITSKSFTNYDQSGSVSWSRAPVGAHDKVSISVIGKKEMRRLRGREFEGNLANQRHGRGRNSDSKEQMRLSSQNSPFRGSTVVCGPFTSKFATHACPPAYSPLLTTV